MYSSTPTTPRMQKSKPRYWTKQTEGSARTAGTDTGCQLDQLSRRSSPPKWITQVKLSCFKIQMQDQFGPKLINLWSIISCLCQVGMTKPEMGASSGPGHNYLRSEHLCGLEGTVLLIKQIRLFRSRKENGDHYSHVKPLFGSMKAWSKMNDPPRFEGCGEEERESCLLVGTEFQVGKMKKVLKMDRGDGCIVGMYFMPWKCTLKSG